MLNYLLSLIFIFSYCYILGAGISSFIKIKTGDAFRVGMGFFSSFIFIFLSQFTFFITNYHTAVICIFLLLHAYLVFRSYVYIKNKYKDNRLNPEIKFILLYFFFTVIYLIAQVPIHNFYGAGWYSDWFEHYERAIYYTGDIALKKTFSEFGVATRPPFVNTICSFFLLITGKSFSNYQVILSFLSCSVIIPIYLLMRFFDKKTSDTILIVCSFLIGLLLPTISINILYPWTRMAGNAFFLMAFYLYIEEILGEQKKRYEYIYILLACSFISHYSTIIPILMIVFHLIYRMLKAKNYISLLRSISLSLLVMLPWFLWNSIKFGAKSNIVSTTPWNNMKKIGVDNLILEWVVNLKNTIVPFIWTFDPNKFLNQNSFLGALYDHLHIFWASSLIGSLSVALVSVVFFAILLKKITFSKHDFYIIKFCAIACLLSFVIIPNKEIGGIVHLALQTEIIILYILLFVSIKNSKFRKIFLVTAVCESFFFYFLKFFPRDLNERIYNGGYRLNLLMKNSNNLQFIADTCNNYNIISIIVLTLIIVFAVIFILRNDSEAENIN